MSNLMVIVKAFFEFCKKSIPVVTLFLKYLGDFMCLLLVMLVFGFVMAKLCVKDF